ncbi:MAG: hypothetical protein ACYDC6_08395 [Acidobacteriaceae bacterium]
MAAHMSYPDPFGTANESFPDSTPAGSTVRSSAIADDRLGAYMQQQEFKLGPALSERQRPVGSAGQQVPLPTDSGCNMEPPQDRAHRRLHRVISREQGIALETLGHAVDYLNDCQLNEGPDDEPINCSSSATEAVQILISLHVQMLRSLPLVEPLSHRIWTSILQRIRHKQHPVPVIPLSSR